MAIKVTSLKCPECNSPLLVQEGMKRVFCQYCGYPIALTDENEYTYHYVDEADVIRAKTEHEFAMKSFEKEECEKSRQHSSKKIYNKRISIRILLSCLAIAVIVFLVRYMSETKIFLYPILFSIVCLLFIAFNIVFIVLKFDIVDGIFIPYSTIDSMLSRDYREMRSILSGMGFHDIECCPIDDIKIGILAKQDRVSKITIGGYTIDPTRRCFRKFSPDSSVVITYHNRKRT